MVYYYEGVANLTEEEGAHEKAFYGALQPIMKRQHICGKTRETVTVKIVTDLPCFYPNVNVR